MDKADSLRGLTKVGRGSLARLSLANLASLKDLRAELERIAKGEQTLSILNHLTCLGGFVARFDKGGEG